jgi:hypothetical protein
VLATPANDAAHEAIASSLTISSKWQTAAQTTQAMVNVFASLATTQRRTTKKSNVHRACMVNQFKHSAVGKFRIGNFSPW